MHTRLQDGRSDEDCMITSSIVIPFVIIKSNEEKDNDKSECNLFFYMRTAQSNFRNLVSFFLDFIKLIIAVFIIEEASNNSFKDRRIMSTI